MSAYIEYFVPVRQFVSECHSSAKFLPGDFILNSTLSTRRQNQQPHNSKRLGLENRREWEKENFKHCIAELEYRGKSLSRREEEWQMKVNVKVKTKVKTKPKVKLM
jgi:hypothetical protein